MRDEMNFVELEPGKKLFIDLQYPKRKMMNATGRCLVRAGTAQRLEMAARALPEGLALCVWDAWRPFALQKELYRKYGTELDAKGLRKDDFICPPYAIFGQEPVHTTGGAVDVTLCGSQGQRLDMGTGFDEFVPASHAFAEGLSYAAMERRALLRGVMREAGFALYEPEWWHFDYGDRFWAGRTGYGVKYRGIFTEDGIVTV